MPRVLYVPLSGSSGTGEAQRCLLIAQAAKLRWPRLEQHFVLSRHVPNVDSWPFLAHLLPRSPALDARILIKTMQDLRPDVVLFDSAAGRAALTAARAIGARTVYLSSCPSARKRGYSWRYLPLIDEHWQVHLPLADGGPGWFERYLYRLRPLPKVFNLGPLFEQPDTDTSAEVLTKFAVTKRSFLLVCPDDATADTPYHACAQVLRARGHQVVCVLARKPANSDSRDSGRVTPAELIALLRNAKLAVVNGGSLFAQSLVCATPAVGAALASDQAARLKRMARLGLTTHAGASAPELFAATERALAGADMVRSRLAGLGLKNGLPAALDRLAVLAGC